MSGRLAVLLLGLACLVAGLLRRAQPADSLQVQLVAPPLTRIDSLGDRPIGGATAVPSPAPGPPPAASGPLADPRGHALRVQVEADAIAIAQVLGAERVDRALARREALSAELAETATWEQLVASLRAVP